MTETNIPALPGGTGITHLRVYDTITPDGLAGGSPHTHFACTEAYLIVAGRGTVQTLGPDGYAEVALEPGKLVWFTPGLIHRLINSDGRLEILVVMQNAGLPEAGDAVLTFPTAVLADEAAYFRAASLAASGHVYARDEDAAYARRDLAVQGFAELRAAYDREGTDALAAFYRTATRLIQPKLNDWRAVWQQGPVTAAEQTGAHLDALAAGRIDHLLSASIHARTNAHLAPKLGMCGLLGVYPPEGEIIEAGFSTPVR